jgi:Leucine-rich repeat (LRR) protein
VRITLGVMMIAVLAVGGALGWFAYRVRVQREAVAAIQKVRGVVFYNGQTSARGKAPPPQSHFLRWLRRVVGEDCLDTATFVGVSAEQLDDRLMMQIGRLNGIENLNIQGRPLPAGLTERGISQIRRLTRLKSFVVQGPLDTTGFLSAIGPQRHLRRLWLASASATDTDMVRLGQLAELENLQLDGSRVSDVGFSQLANLRKMKQLTLQKCFVADLSPVRSMPDLDRLILGDGTHMSSRTLLATTVSLEPVRGKKKLTTLSIGNIPTDDDSLQVIATLPALLSFSAAGIGITEKGLANVPAAPRLFSVQLPHTSISDLRPLGARAAQLVVLDLHGSPITDAGLAPFARSSRMTRLVLSNTKITDAGLVHLSAMNRLSNLWLDETKITDAGLADLSGLTALTFLKLNGTRVTGAGMAHLAGAKRLADLDVGGAAVTDAGVPGIAKIRSLRLLVLRGAKISDDGLALLKPLRGLEQLVLSGTRISDAGLEHLIAMSRLRMLSISGTNTTDAGLEHLAKIRSLKTLYTHATRISDAGIRRLKEKLPGVEVVTTPPKNAL